MNTTNQATPLVSVVIPVYNAANYLHRCLDSIVKQSYINLEIIVVDDGSTDDSWAILQSFVADRRLQCLQKENSGPSDTRNWGITRAKGTYMCFVDADDKVELNYVEVLVNAMLEHQYPDIVINDYTDYSIHAPEGVRVFQMQQEGSYSVHKFMPYLFKGTMGVLWGKMFKTELIKVNGLKLDTTIKFQEDLVFVFTYIQYSQRVFYKPVPTYHYNRLNENSLSAQLTPAHAVEFEKVQAKLLSLTQNNEWICLINERTKSFYINYLLGLPLLLSYRQFVFHTRKIEYNYYSSEYTGRKEYYPFFIMLKSNLFWGAYIYQHSIHKLKRLKKHLLNY